MIETIKKSVLKMENELDDALVFFKGKPYTKRESYWRPLLLTSHLALLEDLIKREEGEMKDWLSKFMLNHQEENDEWGNGYANAYKEAKTDTITHLKSLQEQITSLRR